MSTTTDSLRALVNAHAKTAHALSALVKARRVAVQAELDAFNDTFNYRWGEATADQRTEYGGLWLELDELYALDVAIRTAGQVSNA